MFQGRRHRRDRDNDHNRNDNNRNDNDDNRNDDNGNDNDDNGNGNDNVAVIEVPAPVAVAPAVVEAPALAGPIEEPATVSACIPSDQGGNLTLAMASGSSTVTETPISSTDRPIELILERVDPSLAPPPPGPRLGDIIFNLRAQSDCQPQDLAVLPGPVNLGIAYAGGIDDAHLRIALLENGQWTDVPTVPDPNNPYVSATVQSLGTYTVYETP